jgi:hypothetical protein
VTSLDRLARSTRDLLNLLDAVAKKGAGFRSLRDAWADTTSAHGRLMLTVLGGLAEFERELIRTRTGEGRQGSNALYASYCKLWLNLVHGQGSPAERKMSMVIGRPLLKLNASRRGPRS